MSGTGRSKVLARLLVIGLGIPSVILVMELAIQFTAEEKAVRYASGARWLIVALLALLGAACWALFGQVLYRRLWSIYSLSPDSQDAWSFAEGAYGLIGVGISLNSVIGFFYYAVNRDPAGSFVLFGLALALLAAELLRFPGRMDELEEREGGRRGDHQEF